MVSLSSAKGDSYMTYCYNMIGNRFPLYEPPLEPPDCWQTEREYSEDDEYYRAEDEFYGRFNRY